VIAKKIYQEVRMKFAKFSLIVVAVAGLAAFAWASEVAFAPATPAHGPTGPGPGSPDLATEQLFQGDMIAEIGLGCSNASGTSGGPNDLVVGVTATLTPPFGITSWTYNVFTNVSPTLTAWTFGVFPGTAAPAVTASTTRVLTPTDAAMGTHTVAIAPPVVMSAQTFFFGVIQPQTNVGFRIGLDTSSPSAVTSYIRAPSCGAAAFQTVDSLGFLGNWVMAVIIDDTIPVELMTFTAD
jgi:hypothetical protein